MKHINEQELKAINEINGTKADRYEYFEELAKILGGTYGRFEWMYKKVACVRFADGTILDIETKTVRGVKVISYITVHEFKTHDCESWEYKKGTIVKHVSEFDF